MACTVRTEVKAGMIMKRSIHTAQLVSRSGRWLYLIMKQFVHAQHERLTSPHPFGGTESGTIRGQCFKTQGFPTHWPVARLCSKWRSFAVANVQLTTRGQLDMDVHRTPPLPSLRSADTVSTYTRMPHSCLILPGFGFVNPGAHLSVPTVPECAKRGPANLMSSHRDP